MKRYRVVVPWRHGLHLRPAAALVRAARGFHAQVRLRCGDRIADLRSVLSLLALCATLGAAIDIEASGEDEQPAADAVAQVFASGDEDASSAPPNQSPGGGANS